MPLLRILTTILTILLATASLAQTPPPSCQFIWSHSVANLSEINWGQPTPGRLLQVTVNNKNLSRFHPDSLELSPDGRSFVASVPNMAGVSQRGAGLIDGGVVAIFDSSTLQLEKQITLQTPKISFATYLPDGKHIVIGLPNFAEIEFWSAPFTEAMATIKLNQLPDASLKTPRALTFDRTQPETTFLVNTLGVPNLTFKFDTHTLESLLQSIGYMDQSQWPVALTLPVGKKWHFLNNEGLVMKTVPLDGGDVLYFSVLGHFERINKTGLIAKKGRLPQIDNNNRTSVEVSSDGQRIVTANHVFTDPNATNTKDAILPIARVFDGDGQMTGILDFKHALEKNDKRIVHALTQIKISPDGNFVYTLLKVGRPSGTLHYLAAAWRAGTGDCLSTVTLTQVNESTENIEYFFIP